MPKRTFYYRFVNSYRIWHEELLDFMYYTIPFEPATWQYCFPSEYIGQNALYETVRELYSRDPNCSNLLREESLLVSRMSFAPQIERVVDKLRKEFREKNGIPQDGVVLFVAPGNEKSEAEFSLDQCRLGIEGFIRKYSSPSSLEPRALPSTHFTTVISIQKGGNPLSLNNCE